MIQINILTKVFKQYAGHQSYATAFSELLEYMLIPFKKYKNPDEQNSALEILTNHKKKDLLVSLITEIGELSEGFNDPLGSLYEQLISKGHLSQYFTPEHVSDFMASITLGENMLSGQTVYDPTCGSGRMLLSAAKINRHLLFYGADIDPVCCKITLLNMLLNSMTGEITQMDSLSNHFLHGI